jgi:hypothetical protein
MSGSPRLGAAVTSSSTDAPLEVEKILCILNIKQAVYISLYILILDLLFNHSF